MRTACLLAGVVMWMTVVSAATPPIKIIAHADIKVSHLSSEDLRGVFLETKTSLADGSQVEPVLLKSGDVYAAFVRQYIGKTTAGLDSYYRSLVFAGKGAMPKAFASDAEVVAYVRSSKGAIGYVGGGTSTDGVNVLDVK